MMNESVSSIMTTEVYTSTPSASLAETKKLMDEHQLHHIPILEGKALVGIISSSDLLALNRSFDEYASIKNEEVMVKKVATLTPKDKVGSVAELILMNKFHAIPVINSDKNLEGIVSVMDLVKYSFKKEYPHKNSIHEKLLPTH